MKTVAFDEMEKELIEDLTKDLSAADESFNPFLLESKVKNAMREVQKARRYPNYYTDEQIKDDMMELYSNVRNIALYDYNKIGSEFENSHSESGTSRSYMERDSLFYGIIPLSVF